MFGVYAFGEFQHPEVLQDISQKLKLPLSIGKICASPVSTKEQEIMKTNVKVFGVTDILGTVRMFDSYGFTCEGYLGDRIIFRYGTAQQKFPRIVTLTVPNGHLIRVYALDVKDVHDALFRHNTYYKTNYTLLECIPQLP